MSSGRTSDFRIGLLGHGAVGARVEALLDERAEEIERLVGRRPVVSGVLTRSRGDFADILANSDLIVELIGGLDPARAYIRTALEAGKPVVTANKQLLPVHGEELWGVALDNDVQLRFEAAVAGVVPIIRVLKESLAAAPIDRLHGIVNGTTNYILTQMEKHGTSYGDALAEAQALGYAEADPAEDVSGKDAAAKMAILARLAFGRVVALDEVTYEGIDDITAEDLAAAEAANLRIKLIGTAERTAEGISVRAHPTLVYRGHPLASVSGSFNAITIESKEITEITMSGPGAGGDPTATAVLGDIVSVMTRPACVLDQPHQSGASAAPITSDFESAFFVYMKVADQPGVLAEVATILGRHQISIKDAYVREIEVNEARARSGDEKLANMTLVLHSVRESRFELAMQEIRELDCLRSAPRRMRALEPEFTQ